MCVTNASLIWRWSPPRRVETMNRTLARKLGDLLVRRPGQTAHEEPYVAADLVMSLVFGILHERFIFSDILEGGHDKLAFSNKLAQTFSNSLATPRVNA